MGKPPMHTDFTRLKGGIDASKSKLIWETWGKRPSSAGYKLTEFSRAAQMACPLTRITTVGSSKGRLRFVDEKEA